MAAAAAGGGADKPEQTHNEIIGMKDCDFPFPSSDFQDQINCFSSFIGAEEVLQGNYKLFG